MSLLGQMVAMLQLLEGTEVKKMMLGDMWIRGSKQQIMIILFQLQSLLKSIEDTIIEYVQTILRAKV